MSVVGAVVAVVCQKSVRVGSRESSYDGPLLPKISMLNSKDKLIPNMRGIADSDMI